MVFYRYKCVHDFVDIQNEYIYMNSRVFLERHKHFTLWESYTLNTLASADELKRVRGKMEWAMMF